MLIFSLIFDFYTFFTNLVDLSGLEINSSFTDYIELIF